MSRKFTEAEYRVFELEARIAALRMDIACLHVVNKQKSIAVLEQAIVLLEAEIAALKTSQPRNRDCISCGAEVPDSADHVGAEYCEECWRRAVAADERRHPLTRTERLQGLADRGTDTWEEYRNER